MVFAGRKALYAEEDEPDPINNYGEQKAEAELLVKQYAGPWCIVRPALIYGGELGGKSSFLSWMLNTLKSRTGSFYTDERRSPVWVHDLAKLLTKLSTIRYEGIVHAGGLECLSRAEFAQLAADVWEIPHSNIKTSSLAADPASAWRPGSVCLSSEKAHNLIAFHKTRAALQTIKNNTL
jgi:dTDP-4-dehydrorhamnose reductase